MSRRDSSLYSKYSFMQDILFEYTFHIPLFTEKGNLVNSSRYEMFWASKYEARLVAHSKPASVFS